MEVGVEMIAEDLTLMKYISPVPASEFTEALCEDWPHITEKVLDILDAHPSTKSRVTSIALFKLGFSEIFDKNPLTVYISVDYESEESKWPPVIGEIQQTVNSFHHNLCVHMEHNTSGELYAKFPLVKKPIRRPKLMFGYDPSRKYKKLVGLGEDIGPKCYLKLGNSGDESYFPGFGTLRCWIEMKTRKEPEWTKYALTNYHVVRPAFDGFRVGKNDDDETVPVEPVKDSDLWKVDLKGMGPSFASEKAGIEHPTREKHCFAVQILTERIEKNRDPDDDDDDTSESGAHLNDIKSFFDNNEQHVGSIYCASAYTRRTRNDGRLDWALIKPTGTGITRIGKNTLPTREDWDQKGYAWVKPRARGTLKQPPNHGLRSVANGDSLFKLGTTTGATGGVFSSLKSKVKFLEDAHVQAYVEAQHRPYLSNEFLFLGYADPADHRLAKKGDSGSVVFDSDGRAVGLLSGGQMVQQAASSYSYIMSIDDIFDDIKAFSKQEITDIRIAEDS